MYPTIVVIIVNYKSSKEESYGISALVATGEIAVRDVEAHPETVGQLSCAVPPSTTASACTVAPDSQEYKGEEEKSIIENHGMDAKEEKIHA